MVAGRVRDTRHGNVARQSIAGAVEVADHGTEVGFAEQLGGCDLASAEGVDLTEQVIVAVVRETADQAQFVRQSGEVRHDLCEMDPGESRGNGRQSATNFLRGVRLGIEGVDM